MSSKLDHLADHISHHIHANLEYYIPPLAGTGGGLLVAVVSWGDAAKLGLVVFGAVLSAVSSFFVTRFLQRRFPAKKQENHDLPNLP